MTITAICGAIGSGKSLKQLEYAIDQAQLKRKRLVTNFALNLGELLKYASMRKYGWISHLVDTGQIACIDAVNELQELLIYPNSVVCLDEAGIFLNTREFAKTPKQLLMDLAQSRKFGADLIYAAQFDEQVDKQFRMLTQYFIHSAGMTVYDKHLRAPKLVARCYFYFDADSYFHWVNNTRARMSFFRTYFAAFRSDIGLIDARHKQLFNCFSSFARLDKQQSASKRMSTTYDYSVPRSLFDTLRIASQRDSTRFLGYPLRTPQYAYRGMVPYNYALNGEGVPTLTVQYCSRSAGAAGWSMASALPDCSCSFCGMIHGTITSCS